MSARDGQAAGRGDGIVLVITVHTIANVIIGWVGVPEREIDERVAALYS